MATIITDECINCGACVDECPTEAISRGEEIYVIDPDSCVECVGFHDDIACAAVCPVDACVTSEPGAETKAQLLAKLRRLFPDREFGDTVPSHFEG